VKAAALGVDLLGERAGQTTLRLLIDSAPGGFFAGGQDSLDERVGWSGRAQHDGSQA
jgi:hypothetical protein